MLKLIYHTAVFGPIDLEYDQPVIRVGRSEDNDLVLRHPSVEPHHCLLVFRDEKVLCLPPSHSIPSLAELRSLTGPELSAGDPMRIGDLLFNLAHSSKSVVLPTVDLGNLAVGIEEAEPATEPSEEPNQPRYYCPRCRAVIPETQVKRVGLVGHTKRSLCPKCSNLLEKQNGSPEPSSISKRLPR